MYVLMMMMTMIIMMIVMIVIKMMVILMTMMMDQGSDSHLITSSPQHQGSSARSIPALMRLGRPRVSALTTRCDLMYFTASFEARR